MVHKGEWLHHAWVYGEGGHWYIRGSGYTMHGYMVRRALVHKGEWLHHAWRYGEGGHWYIRGSGYTMHGYMVKEDIGT